MPSSSGNGFRQARPHGRQRKTPGQRIGRNLGRVEYRTFHWVDWYNRWRLMEPLGDIPPTEFEQAYYAQQDRQTIAA